MNINLTHKETCSLNNGGRLCDCRGPQDPPEPNCYGDTQLVRQQSADLAIQVGRIGKRFSLFEQGELHPYTQLLVLRFGAALAAKLAAAEKKYGWSDNWKQDEWERDCVEQLLEHVAKGDPRDVAAYCAFAWHHGWNISGPLLALRETLKCTNESWNEQLRVHLRYKELSEETEAALRAALSVRTSEAERLRVAHDASDRVCSRLSMDILGLEAERDSLRSALAQAEADKITLAEEVLKAAMLHHNETSDRIHYHMRKVIDAALAAQKGQP